MPGCLGSLGKARSDVGGRTPEAPGSEAASLTSCGNELLHMYIMSNSISISNPPLLPGTEEAEEVTRGRSGQLFERNAPKARDFLADMADQSRPVAFSPMRNRGKVRGVGFHKQALERNPAGYVFQGAGVLEGHDAGERDMEPQGDRRFGHRLGLGETVHHPPYFGRTLLPHDGERVFGGLARMDDERLAAFARGAYMSSKALALPRRITAHPVVIEPGLADRDDPRVACELDQPRRIHLGAILMVRMHADGRKEIIVSLGKREHPGKPDQVDADAQCVRHAVRAHLFPHLVHLAFEFRKILGRRRPRTRFRVHGRATSRRYCSRRSSTNSLALSGCRASARACASRR